MIVAPASGVAERCLRCWRPSALCYCRTLAPVATRTRVVFLQHPRERTMRMGTARLAHLGLTNSELHVGVRFDDHARVRALAAEPDAAVALLYPGPDATPAEQLVRPPRTLVVLDGTWITARKMLARNAVLRSLPRLSLAPRAPSAYRIRREPAPHCLSTVEATVAALEALEGDGDRFRPLLGAFGALVTTQVAYVTAGRRPYHHERKQRRPRRQSAAAALLGARWADLVVAQAEGNPHDGGGPHELVQLEARRLASGERFAAIVRPRHPLGALTAQRLGLAPAALHAGLALERARDAWTAFLRPTDVLLGWGRFTPDVLAAEGMAGAPWIDLRGEVARRLGHRAHGVEDAARALGAARDAAPPPAGRAARTLAALVDLVEGLGRAS